MNLLGTFEIIVYRNNSSMEGEVDVLCYMGCYIQATEIFSLRLVLINVSNENVGTLSSII